jgi:hypothetical protein
MEGTVSAPDADDDSLGPGSRAEDDRQRERKRHENDARLHAW